MPREPDALLAAYRDRPLPPTRHHDGRLRLIDVTAVDPEDPLGPDGTEDRRATEGTTTADPVAEETTPTTATTTTPVAAAEADTAARVERRRFYVGDLVVRRFRLWSVLKVALASFVCLFAVLLLAGVILWHLANREGWVTGWTGFLVDIGFTDAAVDGTTLFRASITAAGVLVATATFLTVASACIYNQISGLVGGVEMTFGPRRRRGRERRHPLR